MYGKAPKMTGKKAMPITVVVAVGKPRPKPVRGSRTATNKMAKKK